MSGVCLLSFCLAKNESNKEKDEFFNCSAEKKKLYARLAVRLSSTCAEIIAAVWGLLGFSIRGNCLFLFFVLLSFLRQKLRRDHGLGDSALMIFID